MWIFIIGFTNWNFYFANLSDTNYYITSKKTTQGDTCLVEILVTSKDEDVLVQQIIIGTTDINNKNLTFDFVWF